MKLIALGLFLVLRAEIFTPKRQHPYNVGLIICVFVLGAFAYRMHLPAIEPIITAFPLKSTPAPTNRVLAQTIFEQFL